MMTNFNYEGFNGNEIKKELQGRLHELVKEVKRKEGRGLGFRISDDADSFMSCAILRDYLYKETGYKIPLKQFWSVPQGNKSYLFYVKQPQGINPITSNHDIIAMDCANETYADDDYLGGGGSWVFDNHVSSFTLIESDDCVKMINPNSVVNVNSGYNSNYSDLKYGGSTVLMLLALLDHPKLSTKEDGRYTLAQQLLLLNIDSTYMSFNYDAYNNIWSDFLDLEKYFDDWALSKNSDYYKYSDEFPIKRDKNEWGYLVEKKVEMNVDGRISYDEGNLNVYKKYFPTLDFDFLFDAEFDLYIEFDKEQGYISNQTKKQYNEPDTTLFNLAVTKKKEYKLNTQRDVSYLKRVSKDWDQKRQRTKVDADDDKAI